MCDKSEFDFIVSRSKLNLMIVVIFSFPKIQLFIYLLKKNSLRGIYNEALQIGPACYKIDSILVSFFNIIRDFAVGYSNIDRMTPFLLCTRQFPLKKLDEHNTNVTNTNALIPHLHACEQCRISTTDIPTRG